MYRSICNAYTKKLNVLFGCFTGHSVTVILSVISHLRGEMKKVTGRVESDHGNRTSCCLKLLFNLLLQLLYLIFCLLWIY